MTEVSIENKSLLTSNNNYFSTVVILTISIVFALLIGSGLYGFGNDYYSSYYRANLDWGGFTDRLGFILATLSINGVHIGVQIVTFILSLSVGFLLREHIKFKQSYSFVFFILLYLIAIHTWPIIMSTSNAMRQGLSMSFIFLSFVAVSRRNYYWMLLLSFLAILTHKSGLVLAAIVVFAPIVKNYLGSFSTASKAIINFFIGTFLLFSAYLFFGIIGLDELNKPSKIIGGDFRGAFVLIGLIYVALSFVYKSILANSFNISLYYFSFIAPSLLLNGLNWEYERLGMMMLIPYILSFGILLNRSSYQIYLMITFVLLLMLTVVTGMYASFR
tara:strand:- start:822 stop:1814 length:993 start_codon:yes stop_codon:yes gene_type:complete